jgi:hypothetical protein
MSVWGKPLGGGQFAVEPGQPGIVTAEIMVGPPHQQAHNRFAKLTDLIEAGDLTRVQPYTAELAPHSFVNFWTFDPTPMMHLAGHRTRAITYMMGNNVIVETMFRHDPGVMLYAPLRTEIYEDTAGRVHFSIDQPSSRFASFGDARIAAVGADLDAKLAALLRLMAMPVPPELEQPHEFSGLRAHPADPRTR